MSLDRPVEAALVVVDSSPQGGVDPVTWRIEQHVAALRGCGLEVVLLAVGPAVAQERRFGAPVLSAGLDLGAFFRAHEQMYSFAVVVGGGTAHRVGRALREHQPHCTLVVDSATLLSLERPRLPDEQVRPEEQGGRERIADLRRQRDAELIHMASHVWVRSEKEATHVRSLGVGPAPIVVPPVVGSVEPAPGDRIVSLISPHREFAEPDLDALAVLQQLVPYVGVDRPWQVISERSLPAWGHATLPVEVRSGALSGHLAGAGLLVIARPHGPTAWAQLLAGRAVGIDIVATPHSVRGLDDPAAWGVRVAPVDELAAAIRGALRTPGASVDQSITAVVTTHLEALGLRTAGVAEPHEWLCSSWPSRGRDVARQSYLRLPGQVGEEPALDIGTDLANRPLISVLTPVYDTPLDVLDEMVASVSSQLYENWELVLVDDASPSEAVRVRCREHAAREPRIRFVERKANGGIAAASNTALESCSGEFVALLDHDDLLRRDALVEVARAINDFPDVDMLYSDEDKLFEHGEHDHAYAKSGWAPDLHLSYNYTCHFACFRRSVLEQAGGWRLGFDGAQDYDLALRVTEFTDRIIHIPRNLYHWRVIAGSTAGGVGEKGGAWEAGRRAITDALDRRGLNGVVEEGLRGGTYHVSYPPMGRPTVGVIIPTRDRVRMLSAAVDGLHEDTTWRDLEILVVDNESIEPDTLEWMQQHDGPIVEYPHQFSYARMMNLAAEQIDADLLLFLNNDVEVLNPNWVTTMIGYAQQRRVGAVGAKLTFPDGRVQHEGVVLGVGGVAGNVDSRDYFSLGSIERNCMALTGACLMVRPDVFWEVGGFEERLRVAFNDVDLAMRIHQLGYDLVYTPHAELFHQESASRGSLHPEEDEQFFLDRWGAWRDYSDPYYNPRLSIGVQYMFKDEVTQIWMPKAQLVR